MIARPKKRVAVLISGRGSNMRRLAEAAQGADYPAEIVGVISDRADAAGLDQAAALGIPTKTVARGDHADRDAHEAAIEAALADLDAELVCLAGYMRLLSEPLTRRWAGRMLNIHPSLLPLFKGLDTHQRALQAGMRLHGCSVHFVTAETDGGPIVAQAAVPVLPEDTEGTLARRVLAAEHALYPQALALVAEGRVRLGAGGVEFGDVAWPDASSRLISPAPQPRESETDLEQLARITP